MSKPLLSILIPTTPDRKEDLSRLLRRIEYQTYTKGIDSYNLDCINVNRYSDEMSDVEVITYEDDKYLTIGEKRELMYKDANGKYSWQIDSDDDIDDKAIYLILLELIANPDVHTITFEEFIDIDGKIQRSNHSLKYDDWHDNFDGYDYVRTPFMKSVIKTEIARSVPIPHVRFGEDHQWSQALKPHLQTEIHIDKQLYRYIHRSSDFNERYGYDRN